MTGTDRHRLTGMTGGPGQARGIPSSHRATQYAALGNEQTSKVQLRHFSITQYLDRSRNIYDKHQLSYNMGLYYTFFSQPLLNDDSEAGLLLHAAESGSWRAHSIPDRPLSLHLHLPLLPTYIGLDNESSQVTIVPVSHLPSFRNFQQ